MQFNNGQGRGGQFVAIATNDATVQEMAIETGGLSAESGRRHAIQPGAEDGGNTFKGLVLGAYTDHHLQSDNLSDGLKARGLTSATTVKRVYDVDPAFGGPLIKDTLWFWGSVPEGRRTDARRDLLQLHADRPRLHTRSEPSGRQPGVQPERQPSADVAGLAEEQVQRPVPVRVPAAAVLRLLARSADERARGDLLLQVDPDVPVPESLELAGHQQAAARRRVALQPQELPDHAAAGQRADQIAYSDSGTGFSWGNYSNTYGHNESHNFNARFAGSYVTGSHAFKVGVTFMRLWA